MNNEIINANKLNIVTYIYVEDTINCKFSGKK